MVAVDTQLLVYAHRGESPFHAQALRALKDLALSGIPWMIPWPCAHEFLSIVTRRGIFEPPSSLTEGFTALERWRLSPGLRFLAEGEDHYDRLRQLVEKGNAPGALIHDARIATICLSHGASVLWTADRDFSRFPQLRTHNPLVT